MHGVERAREVLLGGVGGHEMESPTVERVVREDHTAIAGLDAAEGAELPDAIEPPRQHLEHDVAHDRRCVLEPGREQLLERLRAGDERRDPRPAVGTVWVARQRGQVRLHGRVDGAPRLLEGGSIERPIPDVAGKVPGGLVAIARDGDQTIEQRQEPRAVGRVAARQPLLEHRDHRVHLLVGAAMRLEHPQQALAQGGCRLEGLDAVVGERLLELLDEPARQVPAPGLERPEVREEILLGTQRAARFPVLRRRLTAEHRGNVHEDLQQAVLAAPSVLVDLVERLRGSRVLAHEALGFDRVDVEAEHQPAEVLEEYRGAVRGTARQFVDAGLHASQDRAGPGHPPIGPGLQQGDALEGHAHALGIALPRGVDVDERCARAHLRVDHHHHLAHGARERRSDRQFHLHRLEDGQPLARRHIVAGLDAETDHHGGARGADNPRVRARNAVRHSVHLDQMGVALHEGEDVVAMIPVGDPPLRGSASLGHQIDPSARRLDPVLLQPLPVHLELVAVAQVADFHLPPDVGPARRPHLRGPQEELLEFRLGLRAVYLYRGLQQRNAGVFPRPDGRPLADAIEPAHVDACGAHLVTVEQLQEERAVCRSALDGDGALGQRALQPPKRFLTGVANGRQLGEHRAELRRDHVTLCHAGIHAQPRPGRQTEQLDLARRCRESGVHVLRVQAHLDRVARGDRRLPFQAPASRNVQ